MAKFNLCEKIGKAVPKQDKFSILFQLVALLLG